MAFSDLDEELENLRGGQAESIHYEYNDDGDVSSESATLDWDYVTPNAIAGAAIRNSNEDLTDALRWVLQDSNQQDTAHYWQGAAKLGIDLHALGVNSGERLTKAPNANKMGKLWHTLGIHNVTQNANESVEDFQLRMNDPSNFDAMKGDSISSKAGFEHEFSFQNKAGNSRVGAIEAMRKVAKGFVDPGNFIGEGGNARYEIAVDNMTNRVAKHLPSALREQSMYFANKLSSGEKLEFGDSYAAVLGNLPVGAPFRGKQYGDISDLGHNLKGIGEVFGAIHTPVDVERHDLRGVAGWKESAFNYEAANLRDELARSGDEGTYADVASSLGATMDTSFNPMYGSDELAPRGVDIQEAVHLDPNAGLTPQNTSTIRTPIVTNKVKSRRAVSAAQAMAEESAASIPTPDTVLGMPTAIPDQHFREGDENLIVSNHAQGTPEWHAARNSLLTAADAGLVNGGKYSEEGLRRKFAAASGEGVMSESMYNSNFARGHAIEPQNRAWYEKQFGTPVTEMGLIENPKYPGLGVSVDGLVGTDGLFEAKAPSFKFSKVSEGHAYFDQIQMQMAITGRDWTDLSQAKAKQGYVPKGEDPLEYDVVRHKRDDAYIKKQLPKWNKLARDVRIASKTASDSDLAADAFEFRPAQQEADFEARLDKFHSANEKANSNDFEERLQARLGERGLVNTVDKSGKESLSFKEAVREGVVEAEEEITRKKAGGAGGNGGDGGGGGGFFGSMAGWGNGLNYLGGVAAKAGHGDFLGAAGTALKGIPIFGGALAGGLEAVQGLIDRTTDYATNVGDAKVMGVDFNNLNNTQRVGQVYGISQQQSNNLMATTSSASQGMSTGDASGASKIVVGTRGFVTFADIQQYGEEPLALANLAMQRMDQAGLSKGQQAALLRNAGLGDAQRLRGASTDQNDRENEIITNVSELTQRRITSLSGITNSKLTNMKQDMITSSADNGGLEAALGVGVAAAGAVEAGATGAIQLIGTSTQLIASLMSGSKESIDEIASMLRGALGLPTLPSLGKTPERGADGKRLDGKVVKRVDENGNVLREAQPDSNSPDLPSDSKELLEAGEAIVPNDDDWVLDIKHQKPMSAAERRDPRWEDAITDLLAMRKLETSQQGLDQIDASLKRARGMLGKGTDNQSKPVVATKATANQEAQKVVVEVSVSKFDVAVVAKDGEGEILNKASRKGQPAANTL